MYSFKLLIFIIISPKQNGFKQNIEKQTGYYFPHSTSFTCTRFGFYNRECLTCFGGFYRVIMLFGFYNPNCIWRAINPIGWEKKGPNKPWGIGKILIVGNRPDQVEQHQQI